MKIILALYCAAFILFQFALVRGLMLDIAFSLTLLIAVMITQRPMRLRVVGWSAAAFGASAIASTVMSVDVSLSLSRLAWLVECALMAMFVWNISHRLSAIDLFDAVSIPISFIVLVPMFQWLLAGQPLLFRIGTETNNLMGLMSIMIFPAIAFKRLWLVPVSTWIGWFAASRGGTLALLSGAPFYRSRWLVFPVVAAVASMLILRADIVLSVSGVVISRADTVTRIEYWRIALEMWRASPLIGTGLWTGLIYQTVGHAHNLWLNTLAEQGIIGVATLFAFVVSIGRELWIARSWWAIASFVALNVHSLFDVPTSAAYIVLMMSAIVILGIGVAR